MNMPRAASTILTDSTASRALLLYLQKSQLTSAGRKETYLLLPLDPEIERELQTEAAQSTDTLTTR